jgi:hypothetical protein
MNQKSANGLMAKHIFAAVLAFVVGGLLVWVIQLARQGDPVGYIILTGLGVLLSLLVAGLVLYILIIAIGKITQVRPYPNEMKTVYETHRVLEAQNREMARLLTQMQRNPALLANPDQPPVELGPGQVMTPEGFVIDGTAFDTLEDE